MSTQAPGPAPEPLTPDQRFLVRFAEFNPNLTTHLINALVAHPTGGVTITLPVCYVERFDLGAFRKGIIQGLLETDWTHRTAPGTSETPAPTPGPSPE